MSPRVGAATRARAAAVRVVGAALVLVGLAGLASARGGEPKYPPKTPPPPAREPTRVDVVVPTSDGVSLAATYARNGAGKGTAAVVLVHGEDETRASFAPLLGALDEHRVPWLAVDLRGHGASAPELAAKARAGDAALQASMAEDVLSAITFLVEGKGHDPARIAVVGSRLGASVAARATHERKGAACLLAMLTPAKTYAGLDTEADLADQQGSMLAWVFASVEDMNRLDKKGPRHLLYVLEAARNAPPHTPLEERVKRRRGVPPNLRAFAETNVLGTKMLAGVPHFDAWLAALLARRLSTYPNAVLYDGSVDPKGDYADPGWTTATEVAARGGGPTARALRWGRRVMVGASLPKGTSGVRVVVHATRGERQAAGSSVRIAIPSGALSTAPLVTGMGRAPTVETSALALDSEEIPQRDGSIVYGDPSFEAEMRLPSLPGDGPYTVRIAFELDRGGDPPSERVDATSEGFVVLPDLLEGSGIPYLPEGKDPSEGGDPDAPAGRETPDGPAGGR